MPFCTIIWNFLKNFISKNFFLTTAPINERSKVLWRYFTIGKMFQETKHWKGPITTDTNPVPPRQIFCLKTLNKYCLCLFHAVLYSRKVFLNFNIIYKSYKCYNMTHIGEICWLINLEREAVVFQFIISNLFIMMWVIINTSTYLLFESGTFPFYHTAS